MKNPTKIIGLGLLVVVAIIIMFQNTEAVQTKILFFTLTLPRIILLFLTMLIGFVLGILVSYRMTKRKKKETIEK